MSSLMNCIIVCQKFKKKRRDLPDSRSHGENLMKCMCFPYFWMSPACSGIRPRSGRYKYREVNRGRFVTLTLNPPHPNLTGPISTLNGDPKFVKHDPLSLYDTLCVFIYVSIWIRTHTRSSANKIEGGWLGTGREGRGTEVGKEGGRQRTLEIDRVIVWRKGGRDTGRERSNARVKNTCTACAQRLRLIKDALLSLCDREETRRISRRSAAWLAAPRHQRLGERQRHIMWRTKHRKDTVRDHVVQTCLY
jgi:hypothetical protein